MWSVSKTKDDEGNPSGLILHNYTNVATYLFDSKDISLTITRDDTVFHGENALNFMRGLYSTAMAETFSDPKWTKDLREYIDDMMGKLGEQNG